MAKVPVNCKDSFKQYFVSELKVSAKDLMQNLLGAYLEYIIIYPLSSGYLFIDTFGKMPSSYIPLYNETSQFIDFAARTKLNKSLPSKYSDIPGIKNLADALTKLAKTSKVFSPNEFYRSVSCFSFFFSVSFIVFDSDQVKIIGDLQNTTFSIYLCVVNGNEYILFPQAYYPDILFNFLTVKTEVLRHCGHPITDNAKGALMEKIKISEKNSSCPKCSEKLYREEIKNIKTEIAEWKKKLTCIECGGIFVEYSECTKCPAAWCKPCTSGIFSYTTECKVCKNKLRKMINKTISPQANGFFNNISSSPNNFHKGAEGEFSKNFKSSRKFDNNSVVLYLTGAFIEYSLMYNLDYFELVSTQLANLSNIQRKGVLCEIFSLAATYKSAQKVIGDYKLIPNVDQIIYCLKGIESKIIVSLNQVLTEIQLFSLAFCVNVYIKMKTQTIKYGGYSTMTLYISLDAQENLVLFPQTYKNDLFDEEFTPSTYLLHCGHSFQNNSADISFYNYIKFLDAYTCCSDPLYSIEKKFLKESFIEKHQSQCSFCNNFLENFDKCSKCCAVFCSSCIGDIRAKNNSQCVICQKVFGPVVVSGSNSVDIKETCQEFNYNAKRCYGQCTANDVIDLCQICRSLTISFGINILKCERCKCFLPIKEGLCGFCSS